jgi:hypothetical protein
LPLIAYALNPLVLIESLVSPHNEAVMITFVLLAFYFSTRNTFFSYLGYIFSIGVKFISFVIGPFLYIFKTSFNYELMLISWSLALIPVVLQRELYPWYMLPLVVLIILTKRVSLYQILFATTFSLVLLYLPYILEGDSVRWSTLALGGLSVASFSLGFMLVKILWRKKPILL